MAGLDGGRGFLVCEVTGQREGSRRDTAADGLPDRAWGRWRRCSALVVAAVAAMQSAGSASAERALTVGWAGVCNPSEGLESRRWRNALRLRGGGQGWYMDQAQQRQKRGRVAASHGEGKHGQ